MWAVEYWLGMGRQCFKIQERGWREREGGGVVGKQQGLWVMHNYHSENVQCPGQNPSHVTLCKGHFLGMGIHTTACPQFIPCLFAFSIVPRSERV